MYHTSDNTYHTSSVTFRKVYKALKKGESANCAPFKRLAAIVESLMKTGDSDTIDRILKKNPRLFLEGVLTVEKDCYTLDSSEVTLVVWSRDAINAKHLGEIYGYPSCCIESFHGGRKAHASDYDGPSIGYIPCLDCMDQDPALLAERIDSRRLYPVPFPHSPVKVATLIMIAWLDKINYPLTPYLKKIKSNYPSLDFNRLLK